MFVVRCHGPIGSVWSLAGTHRHVGHYFPEYAIPDNLYGLVLASDVFLDRFVTLCNVNTQAMLCHILADQFDAEDLETVPHAHTQQHAAR